MTLRAGDLRTLVSLEQPVYTVTALNERKITGWAPVASIWAQLKELPGKETEAGPQLVAIQPIDVTIRYRSDVAPHWRFTAEGTRHLDVQSIADPAGRRETVVCRCIERIGR